MDARHALVLLIFGIGLYAAVWFAHDNGGVPLPGAGGELPVSRSSVRRLLRRGSGPVLALSVVVQFVALTYVIRAVVVAAGRPAPFESVTKTINFASVMLIAVVWIALWLRRRRSH